MQSSHHLPRKLFSSLMVVIFFKGRIYHWHIKEVVRLYTPFHSFPLLERFHWNHYPTLQGVALHFNNFLPVRTHTAIGIDDMKQDGQELKPTNEFRPNTLHLPGIDIHTGPAMSASQRTHSSRMRLARHGLDGGIRASVVTTQPRATLVSDFSPVELKRYYLP